MLLKSFNILSSLPVRIALLRPNPLVFNVQFEYTTLQFFR
nr:MAG TPA: hypothetical protein [Caudoviricetes sp.]DAV61675.1 MAG TPA: hypothetical protein [Caudoviricetes sp.]